MKRTLIVVSVVLVVILASILLFARSSSGFRSVHLVPSDAVLLVETRDPLQAWDKIIHSKAWQHLSTNALLAELNTDIESYDSLVNSSKFLMKMVGEKPVLISQHHMGNNKYEFLYIIEVGKIGNYNKPEKILKPILGDEYEITTRQYKEYTLAELLSKEDAEYYFMSFVEGKLLFSFDPKLIEASIDAYDQKEVGRNRKFTDVYSKVGTSGLLSFYINHNNLGPLLKSFSSDAKAEFSRNKHFMFSGINFDIDESGMITMEGYSSLSDTVAHIYDNILREGKLELASAEVIPTRIASLAKINFDNAGEYFDASIKAFGEEDYAEYKDNLSKIEKKLKISLEDNFFSWMDSEIVLLQTQPSNLGRNNEFAVILHANDSTEAADNLTFLWKQIKKNSPVKIKNVEYRNYTIDYIAFPGLLKVLFGKMLDKIEKPYFTQIGNNVIISNHPQTLKNLIDDYLAEKTIDSSIDYYNFSKNFDTKTSLYSYFEPPVLYYNLKAFLSGDSWQDFSKNKEYFTCFNQAGIQAEFDNDMIHYILKAQYQAEITQWKKQQYKTSEITYLFSSTAQPKFEEPEETDEPTEVSEETVTDTIPSIMLHSLDDKKQEDFYEDGTLKQMIEIKNGLKHGDYKFYYPNGELKIKGEFDEGEPSGKWKYYNEDGDVKKIDKY